MAAGMSLADIAGDDVSRTMIHFIEHGRAKPSKRVLELIAERTGKPVSYFVLAGTQSDRERAERSLSAALSAAASLARRYSAARGLKAQDREIMKLIESNLRQSVAVVRTVESRLS